MPKMKSNKGARKSFKVTASGKVKREKAFRSHILTKKSSKRLRKLRKETLVDKTNVKKVLIMLQ